MIQIKRETKNKVMELLEIYDNDYKILEKTNGILWNTDMEHPITIAKSRMKDYIESKVVAEKIIEEEEMEEKR